MKIGILQTGHAPEDLMGEHGDYAAMFERLLAGHGFVFAGWDVEGMELPASVHDADGWLITGSKHGVYEDHAWIPPLEAFVRDANTARVPVAGICFGHQLIAQALGGEVGKFPGGWAVGRHVYDIAGQGPRAFLAWHQDQVIRPPAGAEVVARSPFCENAALAYGDRAYSVQWHPEFDAGFIDGLIRTRGRGVVPDALLDQARSDLTAPVAGGETGREIAEFFKRAHARKEVEHGAG